MISKRVNNVRHYRCSSDKPAVSQPGLPCKGSADTRTMSGNVFSAHTTIDSHSA